MTNAPRNPIEWLMDRIRYEQDSTQLRNIAMVLCLSLEDPEPIHTYFGKEMEEEGFYDDYEDEPYDDGSDWLGEDKADWDLATSLAEGQIRGVLGK
jgi:hypothetical protein